MSVKGVPDEIVASGNYIYADAMKKLDEAIGEMAKDLKEQEDWSDDEKAFSFATTLVEVFDMSNGMLDMQILGVYLMALHQLAEQKL